MIHHTHCALRLGDNLAHLHFLRALAKRNPDRRFIHAAHLCYLPQLVEVVCDLPNITLVDLESACDRHVPQDYWTMRPRWASVDAWKNAGGFWEAHPLKNDYAAFYLAFFDALAAEFGLECPFLEPGDLLFDYPALKHLRSEPSSWLVINSAPMSNQWSGHDAARLDELIGSLRGHVLTTFPCRHGQCVRDFDMTVSGVGALSLQTRHILMVSTGPSWPTFNVWNRDTVQTRIVLIDHERIEIAPNTHHCATIEQARAVLAQKGLL